jgi:hypothetical protein
MILWQIIGSVKVIGGDDHHLPGSFMNTGQKGPQAHRSVAIK